MRAELKVNGAKPPHCGAEKYADLFGTSIKTKQEKQIKKQRI